MVEGLAALRGAVVALAALCVLAVIFSQRAGRRQIVELRREVEDRRGEARTMRFEIERLHVLDAELAAELMYLRDQMSSYIAPVYVAPEPIYPSLHLPLVRAAFSQELPPPTPLPARGTRRAERAPVDVDADAGSDTQQPRQLLDLTASEIARLRRAN
jgi:hypothetical protein